MELSSAGRRRYRERLATGGAPNPVVSGVTIETIAGTSIAFEFAGGLTAIVGGNGAGKTSMLGAIANVLDTEPGRSPGRYPEPPGWLSNIRAHGIGPDGSPWESRLDRTTDARHGSAPIEVRYVNVSSETESLLEIFGRDTNPKDLIEGVDPSEFSRTELDTASLLVGRQYSGVTVHEISDLSSEDRILPYISATAGELQYDALSMGRGELAALYLVWVLRSASKTKLTILEEPETHLATRSQAVLLDYLAHRAVDDRVNFLISTHSPPMISGLPDGHAVRCETHPVPRIVSGLTSGKLARHLGLRPPGRLLAVTEDSVAACLLREILRRGGGDLRHAIDVIYHSDGESGVRLMVERSFGPDGQRWRKTVGVLDGDQRAKKKMEGIFYLPSTSSPEILCRSLLEDWRAGHDGRDVTHTSVDTDALLMAMDEAEAFEAHDWLKRISTELGGFDMTMRVTFDLATIDSTISNEIDELLERIGGSFELG